MSDTFVSVLPARPDGDADVWGRALVQPGDGHGAYGCNRWQCADHPDALYTGELSLVKRYLPTVMPIRHA